MADESILYDITKFKLNPKKAYTAQQLLAIKKNVAKSNEKLDEPTLRSGFVSLKDEDKTEEQVKIDEQVEQPTETKEEVVVVQPPKRTTFRRKKKEEIDE